jgi:hypothetical protein
MNLNELAEKLGYSPDHLTRLKRTTPAFVRQFEARMPIGSEKLQRRYAPEKVRAFLAGESVVTFGAVGPRRRAS